MAEYKLQMNEQLERELAYLASGAGFTGPGTTPTMKAIRLSVDFTYSIAKALSLGGQQVVVRFKDGREAIVLLDELEFFVQKENEVPSA